MPYTSIPFVVYGTFKGFLPVVAILTIVVLAFDFKCKPEHFFTPVLINTWPTSAKGPEPYMFTGELTVCVVGMFVFILAKGNIERLVLFLKENVAKGTVNVAAELCIQKICG
jgi:hypothetical protein